MLCTLSIILDVLQGPNAQLAHAFRNFCTRQWKQIATSIHIEAAYNPDILLQVIPGLLRWLQLHVLNHVRLPLEGAGVVPLPNFGQLTNTVLMHEWHQLPRLPDQYRLDVTDPPKTTLTRRKDEESPDPESGRPKLQLNTQTVTAWKAKMEASVKRLKDLEGKAPESRDEDPRMKKKISICLGWHLLGQCYSNCRRKKTHRALSDSERGKMQALVDEHLE